MDVTVNGNSLKCEPKISVSKLLSKLGYETRFVAVAINSQCIRKSSYDETYLVEHDKVEILAPMAGG